MWKSLRRIEGDAPARDSILDFAQAATGYVVNESTQGDLLGNPRMGTQLLQLMEHIFINVLKRVEPRRSDRRCSSALFDSRAEIVFGRVHQAAIGVIDDHEL